MIWKIEPTGVNLINRESIGLGIQLRYCIYLDTEDKNYTERLVPETILVQDGEEFDELENIMIPKYRPEPTGRMLNTPLHNHLIILPHDVSDSLIETVGSQVLAIIKDYHSQDYFANGQNVRIPNTICQYDEPTSENLITCEIRIEEIKNNQLWLL